VKGCVDKGTPWGQPTSVGRRGTAPFSPCEGVGGTARWRRVVAAGSGRSIAVREIVRRAIVEDVGRGDATTLAVVPGKAVARAAIISRGKYVISGTAIARLVFKSVCRQLKVRIVVPDGVSVKPDEVVMWVEGSARGILTAERTALNFLQRMTGIATLTRKFVEKVQRYHVAILDTRKTTPGLRLLEKYAVLCGGGENHRLGLDDMILIKDNHRHFWQIGNAPRLAEAIAAARKRFPELPIEVEVESLAELQSALAAAPDWVMLDNMALRDLRRCVAVCAGRVKIEASGGITLENVAQIAATGVDAISLGCLTHSVTAADLTLEIV